MRLDGFVSRPFARMSAFGALPLAAAVPTKVASLKSKQSFSLTGGNRCTCPEGDIRARRRQLARWVASGRCRRHFDDEEWAGSGQTRHNSALAKRPVPAGVRLRKVSYLYHLPVRSAAGGIDLCQSARFDFRATTKSCDTL